MNAPADLFAVGLNHTTAPIAVRERVSIAADALGTTLRSLLGTHPAREAAIVSTCNRTELYCAGGDPRRAVDWLADHHGVPARELTPHLYALSPQETVRHAFRVASGLDSMVLGETQILGQLKNAVRSAEAAGALGPTLHKLFQRAFAVAKEVRTTTQVGANSVSLAAAAVRVALRVFPSLEDRRVLFIGAGEMIAACLPHFAARTPRSMTIASRTVERAARLAEASGAEAIALTEMHARLAEFDVVVSCTSSELPILGKGAMERVIRARRRAPVVLVDLAVPRDVEPEVARLEDVFLFSIDDLQSIVGAGTRQRQSAATEAERIIDLQVARFLEWMRSRDAVPVIRTLRERGETARRAEVERALRLLARGDDPGAVVEALSHALTNKLLHAPSSALSAAGADDAHGLREAVTRIWRLAP
jgi:glutamyl-tRNA reductase